MTAAGDPRPLRLRQTEPSEGGATWTSTSGSPWAIAGQVIAALITTAAVVCSVVLALLVVESRLGPTSNDPHGYRLIFGSLLLVPTSIVGALALPLVAQRRRRPARMVAAVASAVWVVAALLLAGFALAG